MKLIMLKGLPASGKSTWAKKQVTDDNRFRRVNKDDLRSMVFNSAWNVKCETEILYIRDTLITHWMIIGVDIIVDDTNFNPYHEKKLRQMAEDNQYDFEIKVFDTPLQECIDRDSDRVKGHVGAQVIRDMYEKYGNQIYVI